MILTIDEVKNTRFRMATRRSGYEAADVDVFVDKVEATLIELSEENETLKRQLDAVTSTGGSGADEGLRADLDARDAEIGALREQLSAAQQGSGSDAAEVDRLRAELQGKDAEIAALSSGGDEVARLRSDLDAKDAEIRSLREQVGHLRDAASAGDGGTEHLVVSSAADAAPAVTRLLQMATEQSERLIAEAKAEAERNIGEAQRQAHQTITDAQRRAEQAEAEARANADQVTRDASDRAAQVDRDSAARREELFTTLERERDEFANKVDHLRDFESRFRETFIAGLEDHLGRLRGGSAEPGDLPDLMNADQRKASPTPRLDALMGKSQDS